MDARKTAIAATAAIGIAIAAWYLTGDTAAPPETAELPEAGQRPLTLQQLERMGVKTATAQIANGIPLGTVPGTVTLPPSARVAVSAPFAGSIRQIFVIAGQGVSRGQALATMVSRDALQVGSSLSRARAQLAYAQATANRTGQLAREGVIAGSRAQEANAAVRQAQVDVAENARILSIGGAGADGTITLRAPIGGRVSAVSVQTGGPVDGTVAPFVIDASNVYQLDLQLPERLAGLVTPGMTVNLPGNVSGKILSVGSAIDPETRSILAKASIGAAPGLVTGKTVMASIQGGANSSAVAVPPGAITRLDGREVVLVRTAKGFVARQVVVGGSANGMTVITKGLAANEVVAIEGLPEIKMTLGGD